MNGFLLFDSVHISWLMGILISLIIVSFFYKHLRDKKNYLIFVFLLLFLIEIANQIYLYSTGRYTYYSPPLHLCGLGIFISGFHAFWPTRFSSTLLFSLTLPGAVIALIFPGWATEPVGSFQHIHSFVFHALLIAFVLPPLLNKELILRVKDLYVSVLFLTITVPLIYLYNNKYSTNFMFLNEPVPNTPLQWLYDGFGATGYIASLCIVLLIVWILQYSFYFLIQFKSKSHIPFT